MIVEEKKAGECWCPHVRHPGEEGGTFNRGFEAGNEINTGRTSGNWSCACIGSRCMAWRWALVDVVRTADDKFAPAAEWIEREPSTTHGYCGLAGRP